MKDDKYYLLQLQQLVVTQKNPSSNLLRNKHQDKIDLVQWIYSKTKFLDAENISFSTRIFYILNDIHDLPKCKYCGKELHNINFKTTSTMLNYYKIYCCISHRVKDPEVRSKIEKTTLERHGVKCTLTSKKSEINRKKTCLKKYGVETPLQSKDIRDKCTETLYKNYNVVSPGSSEIIRDKIKSTCIEKYGVDNPFKCEDFNEKSENTCMKKYGVKHISQAKEVQEKIKSTMQERYGCDSYLSTEHAQRENIKYHKEHKDEINKKIQQTNIERYGNKYGKIFGSEAINKIMLTKYGTIHALSNHDIRKKAQKKYLYNNIYFDSKAEIAYYIQMTDNKIAFEYQPNIKFQYTVDGITHIYCPDFIIEKQLVEIKGDHFFNKDGTMCNPYDHSLDNIYKAKHKCMIDNNVKILKYSSTEVQNALKYVNKTYGKDFLKTLKQYNSEKDR